VHCEKMASVINCDYSEKSCENSLSRLILRIFPNSYFNLILMENVIIIHV
jgi:hypothetical protein